ncbi:hypothetical protein ASA1KI_06380 [Opitutales bacterium ASA1]|uniref:SPFH domain-containing protein n=1 Tax=Congregicoccus parvus TaxID=3081749 RepID=UPI002B303A12|nr:hypothetical protein ASA1KI_06380 [Opitutales bacterium ASA1]
MSPPSPSRAQVFVTATAFGAVAVLQIWTARAGWSGAAATTGLVAAWWCVTTLASASSGRRRAAWIAVQSVAAVALTWWAWRWWGRVPALDPTGAMRSVVTTAVAGLAVYAVLQYVSVSRAGGRDRDHVRAGLRLVALLLVLQAASVLVRPFLPDHDPSRFVARSAAVVTGFLVVEWAAAWVLRVFQPASRRAVSACPVGSATAVLLLGGGSPAARLADLVREASGLELRGSWLARFARRALEPLALLLVLGCWSSTTVAIVPVDAQGVRVVWGRFGSEPLQPGLHWIPPWPIGGVRIVPHARIQEFALGFERDLGGAVLWTEVHFSGESNLLVGDGEEVLTFNVPVHYDLPDVVAAERASADPGRMLASLAQRELLLATASRDGFDIMTTDRGAVSREIADGLQRAADDLGLGARVRFLGLKDIHPPVEVAGAFQEVTSAREQGRMMLDLAAANRVTTLADAAGEAMRVRRQSEAGAAERVAAVAGEAAILEGRVRARGVEPGLFDHRHRLEVMEEVVPRLRILIANTEGAAAGSLTLDLREGGQGGIP